MDFQFLDKIFMLGLQSSDDSKYTFIEESQPAPLDVVLAKLYYHTSYGCVGQLLGQSVVNYMLTFSHKCSIHLSELLHSDLPDC